MRIMHPPVNSMTDQNLGDLISASVAKNLDAAFVEKEVEARINKLIVEAVDNALRSWSDTGKLIHKAVEEALRVDRLDLPSYGSTVAVILKEQIEAKVADLVAGQLSKDMSELLSLAPAEVKLSAIADALLEENEGEYGELISVIVETSGYGTSWVYLDGGEVYTERDKYKCEHRLGVDKDGKIFSATIGGKDVKTSKHIGRSYGIEQKLRAYVACGTKLILDEDFVSRGKGDY